MSKPLSWEKKIEKLEKLQAPLFLLEGPEPVHGLHTFQCKSCSTLFQRSYHNVRSGKQFSCTNVECSNRKPTRPVKSKARFDEILKTYEATLVGPYRSCIQEVSIKCRCGEIFPCIPHRLWLFTDNCLHSRPMCPKCRLDSRTGENSPFYNPNKSELNRDRTEFRQKNGFYQRVKEHFNFTCVISGRTSKEEPISSHHLYNHADYVDKAHDVNNGVCITRDLHKEFHKLFGRRNNTAEQFSNFYSEKSGRPFADIYDLDKQQYRSLF